MEIRVSADSYSATLAFTGARMLAEIARSGKLESGVIPAGLRPSDANPPNGSIPRGFDREYVKLQLMSASTLGIATRHALRT